MGDWGAKVSIVGKDISSDTPEDYVFSSKFGSVKVVQQPPDKLPVTVTVNGSTSLTYEIEHALGFIPLAMIFAERTPNSGRYYFGAVFQGIEDRTDPVTLPGGLANTYTTDTSLFIKFTNTKVSQQAIKLYYFIFGDSGE